MADAKATYRVIFFRRTCSLRVMDDREAEDLERMEESSAVARSGVRVEAIAKAMWQSRIAERLLKGFYDIGILIYKDARRKYG
jgi:hypothetical protein